MSKRPTTITVSDIDKALAKFTPMSRRPWTPLEDQIIHQGVAKNYSHRDIAIAMGTLTGIKRTTMSVAARIGRTS